MAALALRAHNDGRSPSRGDSGVMQPGDEISYVMEGEATLMLAGQPSRKVKAGEGFVIPAGTVHNAQNEGSAPIRLVGFYVVEKGKPLASPAAAP